ncbi:MAG: 2-amino-4-hydroxy-6-hydroxymethyldihydropteridine diphosphokinase [Oscillospiraceae bacterium]|nr:2-amino-4-hydroxy-6-hydroxymethyldihydropteridine diphosphokinase [Oscillospiraceae bacterium]
MDKINIKNLEVYAYHGVYPEEKKRGQVFVISAVLYTDLSAAGKTDDLTKTLDYGEISRQIKSFVMESQFDLIETVAQQLAERLLLQYPTLDKVWLEIKKPNAPLELSLETVSVEVERCWHMAYIGLGSNLGDRAEHLRFAVHELDKIAACTVLKVSSLISTPPYGYEAQGDFLNGCLILKTLLSPDELLDTLLAIENKAGRIRDVRWGPRTLDLDIIMYDDLIVSSERLNLPHIEMHKRDFVLRPLCEIAPNAVHPILRKTVAGMLGELRIEN